MPRPSDDATGVRLQAYIRLAALTMVAAALSGCQEHFDRRDTLSYGVGDSVAVNKTTQTIERWPRAAQYDRWSTDGERARIAIDRYRKREVKILPPDPTATSSAATTSSGP